MGNFDPTLGGILTPEILEAMQSQTGLQPTAAPPMPQLPSINLPPIPAQMPQPSNIGMPPIAPGPMPQTPFYRDPAFWQNTAQSLGPLIATLLGGRKGAYIGQGMLQQMQLQDRIRMQQEEMEREAQKERNLQEYRKEQLRLEAERIAATERNTKALTDMRTGQVRAGQMSNAMNQLRSFVNQMASKNPDTINRLAGAIAKNLPEDMRDSFMDAAEWIAQGMEIPAVMVSPQGIPFRAPSDQNEIATLQQKHGFILVKPEDVPYTLKPLVDMLQKEHVNRVPNTPTEKANQIYQKEYLDKVSPRGAAEGTDQQKADAVYYAQLRASTDDQAITRADEMLEKGRRLTTKENEAITKRVGRQAVTDMPGYVQMQYELMKANIANAQARTQAMQQLVEQRKQALVPKRLSELPDYEQAAIRDLAQRLTRGEIQYPQALDSVNRYGVSRSVALIDAIGETGAMVAPPKIHEALQAIGRARLHIGTLKELVDAIQRGDDTVINSLMLENVAHSISAELSRARGEVGTMTEGDIERAKALLPGWKKANFAPDWAYREISYFNRLLDNAEMGATKDYFKQIKMPGIAPGPSPAAIQYLQKKKAP